VNAQSSTVRTLWGLLWRSVVLTPLFVAYLILLCGAYLAWVALPFMAAFCAWSSEWGHAVLCAAAWFPLFLALRWWWRRELSEENWGAL